MRFYLEAYDSQARALPDLQLGEITVLEDGREIPANGLTPITRKLRLTVAVNENKNMTSLATQGSEATIFQAIKNNLREWSTRQNVEFGEFNLASNTGLQMMHGKDPAQWPAMLDAWQPDAAKTASGLNALVSALDLAEGQKNLQDEKAAILFITTPMAETELTSLENLTAHASSMRVPVFVWYVVPRSNPDANQNVSGLAQMQILAAASGGKFNFVSAGEGLPRLEDWVEPLRIAYEVGYSSLADAAGKHRLGVRLAREGMPTQAEKAVDFTLNILPPNPIFISPPLAVERTRSQNSADVDPVFQPDSQDIRFVVEFPDGHPRPLQAARLLVNKQIAAETTAEPFTTIVWDISGLTSDSSAVLQLEVVDSLGMRGESSEILLPLRIIEQAPSGLLGRISPQGMVAIAAVALAGVALALVLVFENRRNHQASPAATIKPPPRRRKDPLTQPVRIPQEVSTLRRINITPASPTWPRGTPLTPARMMRMDEAGNPQHAAQVALNRPEITFGSDPRLALVVLADPSVSPLHARLILAEDGRYRIEDRGSASGTWVNLEPCDGVPVELRNGDQVHFGKVIYRFEVAGANKRGEVQILPLQKGS